MKGSSWGTIRMGWEQSSIQMEMCIKVSSCRDLKMDMEYIIMLMEISMKAIILMIKNKVKEGRPILMESCMKVVGSKT